MAQQKITGVQPNGSFTYQNGPLAGKIGYGFIYTFEDGTTGRCVHMTEQPKFNVGDSVEIEEAGNDAQNNRKVKLQKPGGGNYGGGKGGGDSVGAMVGNALNNAVLLLCNGKAKPHQGEDLKACLLRLGGDICDASTMLKAKYAPQKAAPQQQAQQAQPQQQYQQQPAQQAQPQNQPTQQEAGFDEEDDVPF